MILSKRHLMRPSLWISWSLHFLSFRGVLFRGAMLLFLPRRGVRLQNRFASRKGAALVALMASVPTEVPLLLMSARFEPMFSTMQSVKPKLAKVSLRASCRS